MLDQPMTQIKKRSPWTEKVKKLRQQEDELLQQFVSVHINQKGAWTKISEKLMKEGYLRNAKDCRERFQNYLDLNFNKNRLTKVEVDQLFGLILDNGNKWTCIAEKLNKRTDQDVKNQFYALVKRVFRRLLKASLSNDFKNQCTKITASLRPILILNIFCNNHDNNQKYPNISNDMKELFINLIIKYRSIELGDQLDENVKKQVLQLSDYLLQENYFYIQLQDQKRSFHKRKFTKTKLSDNIQQQNIIKRIKKKQPIFIMNQSKFLQKVDLNFGYEIKPLDDEQLFIESFQIVSRPPFYDLNSQKKNIQSHSNQLDFQMETYQGEPLQYDNMYNSL